MGETIGVMESWQEEVEVEIELRIVECEAADVIVGQNILVVLIGVVRPEAVLQVLEPSFGYPWRILGSDVHEEPSSMSRRLDDGQ